MPHEQEASEVCVGPQSRYATPPDHWVQVEHQEDPNVASQQIDDQKAEHIGRLQRVKALALHLNHYKTFAQSHHRCCTCDRPLNPATELAPFIRKQVCHTACAAWDCITHLDAVSQLLLRAS